MNIRHLALLITLLCAATARAARCQSPVSTVHEGDRIRVQRYDARHPRIGKLVAHSADSLTVEWQNGAHEAMPMFEVGQVEVSTGHAHYVARGATFGLAIGGAVGFAIKKLVDHDQTDPSVPKRATGTSAMLVALGGGGIFGAITGALGTEQWAPTALGGSRSRVGLVVPVSRREFGVGLSAAF
jgi:hypothetical protein